MNNATLKKQLSLRDDSHFSYCLDIILAKLAIKFPDAYSFLENYFDHTFHSTPTSLLRFMIKDFNHSLDKSALLDVLINYLDEQDLYCNLDEVKLF